MEYIGKYGEYRVLACLLERDIEAYSAIKMNQSDFDITAIIDESIIRIQVKSTHLHNKSTNNSIDIDSNYNFLVIVIYDEKNGAEFFIMSRKEAEKLKGESKKLGLTHMKNGKLQTKEDLMPYKDQWSRLLAGEANEPGSYSGRTVNLPSDFDKADAELSEQL